MATLKQRLHRKNSSGTYDTIHFESTSDLILRPSGRTVEQDLADYLPQVQDNDNVPESLPKLIIGNTKSWINGKEIQFIDNSIIEEGKVVLGGEVKMSGISWIVVHIDRSAGEFVLAKAVQDSTTAYGKIYNLNYKASTIAEKCREFLHTLDDDVQNVIIPKTVHGVTDKIWVPQSNWISDVSTTVDTTEGSSWNGTEVFDYFTNDNSRMFLDANDLPVAWYTSTVFSSSSVSLVSAQGKMGHYAPGNKYGFRPFCCLPLSIVGGSVESGPAYVVSNSAPSDTTKLWIDTSSSNVLKYYDGSTWKPIHAAWA